jgi:pimeloyl-ACP methyl ester carboxylesterase
MEKQPIVLIPGIQGTRLSNINDVDFKTIWSGIKKYFTNIHSLVLQQDGISDKGAENIIERADVENLAYSEIVNYLRSLGYRVYIFGYDWRKSNEESARDLAVFVKRIQRKLRESKINFITHSMGGLVLSAYLKGLTSEEQDKNINRIVFTVPPFLGSVEATYNLVVGKSRLFNTSDDFRKVGRTFPGLYELLPVYPNAYTFEDGTTNFDHYDFSTYWQQVNHSEPDDLDKYKIIIHRLEKLGTVRDQENFIYDLSSMDEAIRERIIVLAGGGESTQTRVLVKKDHENYKFYFDFEKFNDEEEDAGDGTVPLASSTVFKDSITTLKVNTTWIERRADSRIIMSDWHAFFLNNGRIQNILKRFFDPNFVNSENWYQSAGDRIERLT